MLALMKGAAVKKKRIVLPFVTLPGWLIWLGIILGLLAVAYPIAQHYGLIERTPAASRRQARP
jgi:hypothetical protein